MSTRTAIREKDDEVPAGAATTRPPTTNRLFGIQVDAVTRDEAIGLVGDWLAAPWSGRCRYVVTPNVDHVLKLRSDSEFRTAYDEADLVIVDGWPIRSVSQLLGVQVPETIPGSDFVPWLLDNHQARGRRLRVFLLGAAEGVAEEAALRIAERWPCADVVGTLSPPWRFERDEALCESICSRVTETTPDLLVLGLGAPKQEIFAQRYQHQLGAKVALCVGATIDFLAGSKRRAPPLVRQLRLEWLYRSLSEPRRLGRRYLAGIVQFPLLVARELVERRRR